MSCRPFQLAFLTALLLAACTAKAQTLAWRGPFEIAAGAGGVNGSQLRAELSPSHPEGFVEVPADRVRWQAHPAIRGAEYAILLGKPTQRGPLIVRVKLPPNAQVMPHTHPEARTYTVISGEWKLGFGEKYDAAALLSYTPGDLYRLPAKVPHFQASGPSGSIVQIESIGPTSTDFIQRAER